MWRITGELPIQSKLHHYEFHDAEEALRSLAALFAKGMVLHEIEYIPCTTSAPDFSVLTFSLPRSEERSDDFRRWIPWGSKYVSWPLVGPEYSSFAFSMSWV
jgi:hypothetical protein